jgi:uncharacterized protein (DUF305 family)
MKKHLALIEEKINPWNLFTGFVIGFGIGIFVISALVPDAADMIRVYNMENNGHSVVLHGEHDTHRAVTNEKQFLEEMITHHEAAVTMSEQVLKLNPREEVKKLANDIMTSQTAEIQMMKEWLANWK